ncbi:uncharacterized protein LOC128386680 isoform X2 [Panonychus citri]|uniref:uncharacterized protein LOC128386680 isoform X2 n=1 Tax=Panonychus citri TaxID=50023 RepID=UPI002306F5D9|nr:uncharacterized protein LOC128386680 isoform X2 [Panonychus citri]
MMNISFLSVILILVFPTTVISKDDDQTDFTIDSRNSFKVKVIYYRSDDLFIKLIYRQLTSQGNQRLNQFNERRKRQADIENPKQYPSKDWKSFIGSSKRPPIRSLSDNYSDHGKIGQILNRIKDLVFRINDFFIGNRIKTNYSTNS